MFSLLLSADDRESNSKVVLKVFMPKSRRFDENYRAECFIREATLLERFREHPNIISIVGSLSSVTCTVQTTGGDDLSLSFPYYAIEVATGSVRQQIEGENWGFDEKLESFRSMVKGVQRIHAQHIVHRDVKSDNFLVMPDGTTKISDFGTAASLRTGEPPLLSYYGAPVGDLICTSPEVHACLHDFNREIHFRGDLYGLGVCLYQLFSELPFVGSMANPEVATMIAMVSEVPVSLRLQAFQSILPSLKAIPIVDLQCPSGDVPLSTLKRLDDLFKNLTRPDYLERLTDFNRIFADVASIKSNYLTARPNSLIPTRTA